MLKIQEIREIIRLIDQTSISEFSYEHEGSAVTIKKSNDKQSSHTTHPVQQQINQDTATVPKLIEEETKQVAKQAPEPSSVVEDSVDENIIEIVSPMVGTFYRKPSPESDTYVEIGDKVKEDSIVCIVEAMKLFNEIEAEVAGEIVETLVTDGELVEYGQALYKVKIK